MHIRKQDIYRKTYLTSINRYVWIETFQPHQAELAPTGEMRLLLELQVACGAISTLAQIFDQCIGRAPPNPLS